VFSSIGTVMEVIAMKLERLVEERQKRTRGIDPWQGRGQRTELLCPCPRGLPLKRTGSVQRKTDTL